MVEALGSLDLVAAGLEAGACGTLAVAEEGHDLGALMGGLLTVGQEEQPPVMGGGQARHRKTRHP